MYVVVTNDQLSHVDSIDSIDSIDIFFLEAMWIAHTQSLLFSFVCVCVSHLCPLQSLATAPSNRNHNDSNNNNNNRNNNNSSQNNNNDNAPNNSLSKKRRSRPQKTQQSNGGDLSDSSSSSSDQRSPRNNKNRRPRKKKSNNNNNNKNNNNNNNNGPQQQLILSEKEQAKYVAMDCEMVGVGCGGFQSSLARVVMVNWNGQVLLDQYVRPSEPVTDYRTFVSGITKQELEQDSVVDLDTCRTKVLEILRQEDNDHHHNERILVGHGLKSDLMALGIRYPWYLIRDTAKWEPYMKTRDGNPPPASGCTMTHHHHHDGSSAGGSGDGTGCTMFLWPRKLKELCHDKLHRDIQCIGQAHCPVEDAIAALDLYKLARLKWEKTMIYKINKTRQITEQQQHKQHIEPSQQEQPRQFLKPSPNLLQTR